MRGKINSSRRGRRIKRWLGWLGLAALLAGSWWLGERPAARGDATSINMTWSICGQVRSVSCVIDGDTVAIGKRRIRLTGFDAPELDGDCAEESAQAREARTMLANWLNRGTFLLDGGIDPPRDKYGRELRAARRTTSKGDDWLSDWMVARGLAEGDGWTDGSIDWCSPD